MDEKTVKALCETTRKKLNELADANKKADPREKELFDLGFSLLEAHLVNQARMADTLKGLLIDLRNRG